MDDRSRAFDRDVAESGAYRYTSENLESARIANQRYTEMILGSTDFKEKSVVDVGCGDGTFTAQLAECSGAARTLGIEPSPNAISRASQLFNTIPNLSFRCATSDDLLNEGLKFDIAVYRGVIHHVADPEAEIRQALTLAKEVIILEPNGCNPMMKIVERVSSYHREHGEQSYTPGRLCTWVENAGGTACSVRVFGLVPYFCPPVIAHIGHLLEPFIELLPGLRTILCGQYIVMAGRKLHQ